MAGCMPIFCMRVYGPRPEKAWSVKDFSIVWLSVKFFSQVRASEQDSSILPAQVANQRARFGSSCLLTELAI